MTMKNHLKELRENHPSKPSQRFMGDLLGIAENNYRKLENGVVTYVSSEAMNTLCKFFNCNTTDLFEYIED